MGIKIRKDKRIRIESELAQGLNSIFIKNKFRVRYGFGEHEFKPLDVKLMDMNWSWPPIRKEFFFALWRFYDKCNEIYKY